MRGRIPNWHKHGLSFKVAAKAKGIEIDQLVNELLKRDIELIEAAK